MHRRPPKYNEECTDTTDQSVSIGARLLRELPHLLHGEAFCLPRGVTVALDALQVALHVWGHFLQPTTVANLVPRVQHGVRGPQCGDAHVPLNLILHEVHDDAFTGLASPWWPRRAERVPRILVHWGAGTWEQVTTFLVADGGHRISVLRGKNHRLKIGVKK